MSQHLDDRIQNLLYHALGADLDTGLSQFDEVFRQAESNYQLDDLNALLDLIADPTLPDERRPSWHQYYLARKALLRWQIGKAERILQGIAIVHDRDEVRLQPRIELLRGQAQLRRGSWSASRETIEGVIDDVQSVDEPILLVDAYEAIAQAYISQGHNAGGWTVPLQGRATRVLQGLFAVTLLPLYVPLLIGLWLGGAQPFWRPALRFGADYSNWPIFQYYLNAYRSLVKARRISHQADERRRFHLDMMWVGLLLDVTVYRSAKASYEALLEAWEKSQDRYRKALIYHGLAKTILDMGGGKCEKDPLQMLETARETYLEFRDRRAVAYADLLLGDIELANGKTISALEKWEAAIRTFQGQKDSGELAEDPSGLAEGLGRCYAALDKGLPEEAAQAEVQGIIRSVERQVFTVRLPNRLFRFIQVLGWAMPLLVTLVLMRIGARYMSTASSRGDYRELVWAVFSWRGLVAFGGILFAGMVANTLFGLVGLLSTLRVEATRLDLIELDSEGLSRFDFAGSESERMLWSSVDLYLRVERALFFKPTGALSFDYLRSNDGKIVSLPGTTSWFKHLQRAVEDHLGPPSQTYRLRWHGGAILVYLGFVYGFSFLLTDSFFYPRLSVVAHAQVAAAFQLGSFLIVTYVTSKWIMHYTRVNRQTMPFPQFVIGTCLLGVFLLGLGAFGKRFLYPVSSFVIAWGTVLLVGLAGSLGSLSKARWQWILARTAQVIALIAGILLVLHTLFPVLHQSQAYTYVGALKKLDPDQAEYVNERADLFQHLRQAAEWMVRWDPTYMQGFYYLGIYEYFQGNYEASVQAYSKAIDLGTWWDVYHCRALAYHALGDEASASRDVQTYLEKCETCDEPFCQSYFPETEGVFNLP